MIKVAFIGCGGIQEIHYGHLRAMAGVEITGHCDVDEGQAKNAASCYGGEAFTEYLRMYDKVKPDVVYIAVPPYAHDGMEEAAAERGIHLFIEKPVALDRQKARIISQSIRKAGILCSVGYCFRYQDIATQARQYLKGRPICLVTGRWFGGMPDVWWWRRMDKSGGQVVEQTTHMFDLMRYLCGDVAEVYATASTGCMTKVPDYSVHDSSAVSFRLKQGGAGGISSACAAGYTTQVVLEIITPDAAICIADGKLSIAEKGKTTVFHSQNDMYRDESEAFIEAVRTGKKNRIRCSYADALKTLAVTLAVNESIQTGLPVTL